MTLNKSSAMKFYLKMLAIFYFSGAILHMFDLFDLRLSFSEMNTTWRTWTVYLTIGDLIASYGLWNLKKYGLYSFFLISISQLIAYSFFKDFFGNQIFLIGFHFLTLTIYAVLKLSSTNVK